MSSESKFSQLLTVNAAFESIGYLPTGLKMSHFRACAVSFEGNRVDVAGRDNNLAKGQCYWEAGLLQGI